MAIESVPIRAAIPNTPLRIVMVIQFGDILDRTYIVPDHDGCGPPWEHYGFDHECSPAGCFPSPEDMRGYMPPSRCESARVVVLPDGEDYGIYEHLRRNGAARQVAAEVVARERAATIDRIVDWRARGWQYYGVSCYVAIGGAVYDDSLWGISSYDDAAECRVEIALVVAQQLANAGYVIEGGPKRAEGQRRPRTSNINQQNWR